MKKETKLWFDLAQEDYKNMGIMAKSKSNRGAVFFAQQSVEKLIKAYIVEYKNEAPRKTHRIEALIKDAGLRVENISVKDIEELSKSYTWVRYPDLSIRFYTKKEEVEKLLITAKKVFLWVNKKFKNN